MWTDERTDRRRTGGQTDSTNLIAAIRNFAKAPKTLKGRLFDKD